MLYEIPSIRKSLVGICGRVKYAEPGTREMNCRTIEYRCVVDGACQADINRIRVTSGRLIWSAVNRDLPSDREWTCIGVVKVDLVRRERFRRDDGIGGGTFDFKETAGQRRASWRNFNEIPVRQPGPCAFDGVCTCRNGITHGPMGVTNFHKRPLQIEVRLPNGGGVNPMWLPKDRATIIAHVPSLI